MNKKRKLIDKLHLNCELKENSCTDFRQITRTNIHKLSIIIVIKQKIATINLNRYITIIVNYSNDLRIEPRIQFN